MHTVEASYGGRKVMVTGGLGFIGSNLVHRLVDLGADVLVVDSQRPNTGANPRNIAGVRDRIRVCNSDLRNGDAMRELVKGIEVVFNLAGQISHLDSMKDPLADLAANVHAHVVLLEACRHHAPEARIVYASTRQIYGRPTTLPVSETHPLRPIDVNGINKMSAEAYHTLYCQVYGMPTVSLRLTNTFGPRMYIRDGRQTFLGLWLRRIIEGEPFEVWGGQQKRDLTYVDDAVNAFLCTAASPDAVGQVFNIGGSPPIPLEELASLLICVAGCGSFEKKEFPSELRLIDIGDYYADDRLFRSRTRWSPSVPLPEGLARTLAFYRERRREYV